MQQTLATLPQQSRLECLRGYALGPPTKVQCMAVDDIRVAISARLHDYDCLRDALEWTDAEEVVVAAIADLLLPPQLAERVKRTMGG